MHEYLRRINLAHAAHDWLFKPGLYDIEVKHDDYCGTYKKTLCNCDPRITIRTQGGQFYRILDDGNVEQIILT